MMKQSVRRVLRYIAISVIALLAYTGKAQDQEIVVDKIIAKVDNYIVLKSDLERAYLDYLSRGQINTGDLRCRILENLVINKMLVAKAEIDSVIILDDEVQANLSQRMNYMVSQLGSEEEIEKFYGKSLEQIESELFDEVKEQLTIQRMQGTITESVKITPAEVRRFFDAIPRDSLPYFSTEVSVGQIVVSPEPGKAQHDRVFRQLIEIRGQILRGSSFADMARLYSEDPGSGSRGGELPFYKRGELAPEFEAAAMTMEIGELSEPIKTQFGYHLIELQERRGNTFKSRHILITPKPSSEDVANAERFLDSLRTGIVSDSLDFRTMAKEHSDDQMTAMNGGFFMDNDGANRVSVESLDPNIFFTLDTMKTGQVTRPLKFIMPDGSSAFRILYYKDRVAPHQANLKDDYQKIAAAALNEKKSRKMNGWFTEARDDVYIEVDEDYSNCNIEQ